MKHKHKWQFRGIITDGYRMGMSHRMCWTCKAEFYTWATPAELKRHDPDGTIEKAVNERARKN